MKPRPRLRSSVGCSHTSCSFARAPPKLAARVGAKLRSPARWQDGTLVEGIVDLAFEEAGAWTVVDYKTDREIAAAGEDRYRRQVALYASAIAQATGHPRAACWCACERARYPAVATQSNSSMIRQRAGDARQVDAALADLRHFRDPGADGSLHRVDQCCRHLIDGHEAQAFGCGARRRQPFQQPVPGRSAVAQRWPGPTTYHGLTMV